MKFNQVYLRCKEKGIKITKQGLYLAGLKNGFIERDIDRINIFHKDKFEKWVNKKLEKIPAGFYSFQQCSDKLKKPLSTIYFLVKDSGLEVKKIGSRGVKYVRIEELKKYIKIRKFGSEEEYGN